MMNRFGAIGRGEGSVRIPTGFKRIEDLPVGIISGRALVSCGALDCAKLRQLAPFDTW